MPVRSFNLWPLQFAQVGRFWTLNVLGWGFYGIGSHWVLAGPEVESDGV